jgi:phospholipase/carboxylesterase
MTLITHEYGTTKSPKFLVILLHGYGSNGENLIELANEFQPIIPDAYFIAPNAIEPWEGGFPNSYQWFSLYVGTERSALDSLVPKIKNANKILLKFIEEQLQRFNLSYENLILIGFSQGSMMSIYQGLIMPKKIAGIISFSGKVVEPNSVGDKIISKPNICLIHGTNDSVLPFSNFQEAQIILNQHGVPFEAHAIEHLDHTIDIRAVRIAQNFIKKIFLNKVS